jgi:hypothetical protein
MRYEFEAALWIWDGPAAWYFMTLPFELTDEIDDLVRGRKGGFGSVKVRVTIGSSTWDTSLFPSTELKSLILPVKKSIRTKESLDDGTSAKVAIELLHAPEI